MHHRFTAHLTVLAAVALLLFGATQAFAVGTAADTTISNTASLEFTIGGSTPPAINSPAAEFKVDQKVRMVVSSDGNTSVVANVADYALPFTVTNESNTAAGSDWFQISSEAVADDFDMNTVRIYLDVNGDGALDGGDTDITASPYVQIANTSGSNTAKFLIVADAPNTTEAQTPDNEAAYHLIATAWAGDNVGAGILADDDDGNDAGTAEVVYADDAGSATDDDEFEGQHSAMGTYTTLATLTIGKTASNGTSGYHIPGDELTYTITVNNPDTTNDASGVTITDAIPDNTAFVEGSLSCPAGFTAELSNDDQANWTAGAGDTITDVRCSNGTIAAGGSAEMTFNVAIQ